MSSYTDCPTVSQSKDASAQNSSTTEFTQFVTRYDKVIGAIWCFMRPKPIPCVNTALLDELQQLQQQLQICYGDPDCARRWRIKYLVLASHVPGIYSLGGDLQLFHRLIAEQDRGRLTAYAHQCVDLLYANIMSFNMPITLIALIQGQSLGSGFETALSCDIVVAERKSQMGLPEVLFNMFPAMGAYNLLTRRISPANAERMIVSGRTYTAEELYDMGVIDVLADDGEGVQAVEKYLRRHGRYQNTYQALQKVRRIVNPVSRAALIDIVDIWVAAAMGLNRRDLSKMERLLYAQNLLVKKHEKYASDYRLPRARKEWREVDSRRISFPLADCLGEQILAERRRQVARRSIRQ